MLKVGQMRNKYVKTVFIERSNKDHIWIIQTVLLVFTNFNLLMALNDHCYVGLKEDIAHWKDSQFEVSLHFLPYTQVLKHLSVHQSPSCDLVDILFFKINVAHSKMSNEPPLCVLKMATAQKRYFQDPAKGSGQ